MYKMYNICCQLHLIVAPLFQHFGRLDYQQNNVLPKSAVVQSQNINNNGESYIYFKGWNISFGLHWLLQSIWKLQSVFMHSHPLERKLLVPPLFQKFNPCRPLYPTEYLWYFLELNISFEHYLPLPLFIVYLFQK